MRKTMTGRPGRKGAEATCEAVRLALYLRLRGELEEAERRRVERHLASCPACRAEEVAMGAACRLLDRALPEVDPSPGSLERLLHRARSHRPLAPWLRTRAGRALAVPAVLGGGALLVHLLRINARVAGALRAFLEEWGLSLPALFEGPLAPFLAPILFVILCAAGMLLLSPFVLRRREPHRVRLPALPECPGNAFSPAGSDAEGEPYHGPISGEGTP